jgi:hypothetical protein
MYSACILMLPAAHRLKSPNHDPGRRPDPDLETLIISDDSLGELSFTYQLNNLDV